jgi:hypothetical protein
LRILVDEVLEGGFVGVKRLVVVVGHCCLERGNAVGGEGGA